MTEPTLRASTVVAIILRLAAIYWLARGALAFASSVGLLTYGIAGQHWLSAMAVLVEPTAYVTLALLAWIFANQISVKVAGKEDPKIEVTPPDRSDIYGFGLLLVGLYFFLNYLGGSLGHLLSLAASDKSVPLSQPGLAPISQLAANLIPCLAGLAVTLRSPSLGRKLAARTRETSQENRG